MATKLLRSSGAGHFVSAIGSDRFGGVCAPEYKSDRRSVVGSNMLDLGRFGPPDFSGKAVVYPVQWCADMPIGSVASRREIKLRLVFSRLKAALGYQWSHEIGGEWETHVHYEELNAYAAHWGDEKVSLMESSTLVIDLVDWSDRMRELLVQFDPLWVNNRVYRDFGPASVFNRRTPAERQVAKAERESLLAELDAFDAEIGAV